MWPWAILRRNGSFFPQTAEAAGRSPAEGDSVLISLFHPLFSLFYSYCRAESGSEVYIPSNRPDYDTDGLWLHAEAGEGGCGVSHPGTIFPISG